jgi:hypothetical protein
MNKRYPSSNNTLASHVQKTHHVIIHFLPKTIHIIMSIIALLIYPITAWSHYLSDRSLSPNNYEQEDSHSGTMRSIYKLLHETIPCPILTYSVGLLFFEGRDPVGF